MSLVIRNKIFGNKYKSNTAIVCEKNRVLSYFLSNWKELDYTDSKQDYTDFLVGVLICVISQFKNYSLNADIRRLHADSRRLKDFICENPVLKWIEKDKRIITYCKTMSFNFNLNCVRARFVNLVLLLGCVFITYLFSLGFVFAEELADNQSTPTQAIGNENVSQQVNSEHSEQPDSAQHNSAPQFAGEFFDIGVPLQNYYFVKGVISVFGNKWGPQPQSQKELEKVIWDQLVMSFEAFRRGVEVSQEEVDEEITKILAAERVEFDWKKDRASYEKWVKDKTNEPAEVFEGQLKHLIQLHKLRQQIMDSVDPGVSEKEAYEEFMNENNNLSVELIQFDEKKDADNFCKKTRGNSKFWEEEREKRPKDFKRPGAVSLEFLIDIWGFQREAAYGMMKARVGDIYPPAPIYKGYAVFKILAQGHADKSYFKKENVKKSYYDQIKDKKRLKALATWFEDLKKQANIQKYDKVINELTKGEASEQSSAEKEN